MDSNQNDKKVMELVAKPDLHVKPTYLFERPEIDIQFSNISYKVKTPSKDNLLAEKTILNSVSGKFRCGHLTAMMGASGAGKTTLMNILAGYVLNGVSGTIFTNRLPVNMKTFTKQSAYIMQDDLHQPFLTVWEVMMIAARLKLGRKFSEDTGAKTVNEVLRVLGLENTKQTRTQRLSGGEKKRLSVALELVDNPSVIFLDEPTTGLDLVTAKQLLSSLKQLTRQGRNIICTIHQPSASIFYQFDHVYVLAKGLCVYQGMPDQLIPTLSSVGLECPKTYNPADYIIECIQSEYFDNIKTLSKMVENGKLTKKNILNNSNIDNRKGSEIPPPLTDLKQFSTSFFTQVRIILFRTWLQRVRNVVAVSILLFYYIFTGLLCGLAFTGVGHDGTRGFHIFLFVGCVMVFFQYTHAAKSILQLPSLIRLLQREYFNGWYSIGAYYTALVLSSLPEHLLLGPLFLGLSYYFSDQPLEIVRFMWFALFGISTGLIAEALGQVLGTVFPEKHGLGLGGIFIASPTIIAFYGLGFGSMIQPFYRIVLLLSYFRNGLTGASLGLFEEREILPCIGSEIEYCHYRNLDKLLRDVGMEYDSKAIMLLALLVNFVILRLLAYLALRFRLNLDLFNRSKNYALNLAKLIGVDMS